MKQHEMIKWARKLHRAIPKPNKEPCWICGAAPLISDRAHIFPIFMFAVYMEPGTIPIISLCRGSGNHHRLFDDVVRYEFFKGKDWRKSRRLQDDDSHRPQKEKIIQLIENVEKAWEKIKATDFLPYPYDWKCQPIEMPRRLIVPHIAQDGTEHKSDAPPKRKRPAPNKRKWSNFY